jgi:hypothetical protein
VNRGAGSPAAGTAAINGSAAAIPTTAQSNAKQSFLNIRLSSIRAARGAAQKLTFY